MRIDFVVGGTWHAPQVVRAMVALGADVQVITCVAGEAWRGCGVTVRVPMRLALRAAALRPTMSPIASEAFGYLAVSKLRQGAVVVSWSSFARAVCLRVPTLLVRGSTHIETQRELLTRDGRSDTSRIAVAAERYEYQHCRDVTVPTVEIAGDPRWQQDGKHPVVAPYGIRCDIEPQCPTDRVLGRLVSCGPISFRKGFDRLARALPVRLPVLGEQVWIGGRASRAMSLPNWWQFKGRLPHADWHRMLASSGIFILLSREEGMARAGLEALAEGTPIVVTEATGLAALARAGAGIVVRGDEPEEIRAAVAQIRDNWRDFSEAALALADRWSWADHAKVLLGVLARY